MSETDRQIRYIGAALQPAMVQAREAIQPIVDQAGLELIGVEKSQEGRRHLLWVFIDHPDGVTLDHCGEVSPEISAALDLVDPISEAYGLRVSSPGIDRPLIRDVDFERFIGQSTKIKLMTPLQGRRKFQGEILGIEERLKLRCADGEHEIPLEFIQSARLHYTDDELRILLREKK